MSEIPSADLKTRLDRGAKRHDGAPFKTNSAPPSLAVLVLTACAVLGIPFKLHAQEPGLIVGPRIRVSPTLMGRHGLIDLSIDRDNPSVIVACGFRHSVAQNAAIGFVYRSYDAGHTWHEVLKDDSSYWVTEDSCALGAGGRVFFMAESQLLDHGKVRHVPLEQQGDIHLYSSFDTGQTWKLLSKRGWFDHTAMALDWTHGPRRGRMYLFGGAKNQDAAGTFRELQVITSDDGKDLLGPVSAPKPATFRYGGVYASAARVLPNGDAVAAFLTRRSTPTRARQLEQPVTSHVEVFATRDGGSTLKPVADFGAIQPCRGATSPSLDANLRDGTIYVAWSNLGEDHCEIHISSSSDGGKSWSSSRRVAIASDGFAPSIAVNDKGIVGLFWLDQTESHCWRFTASADNTQTFSKPISVSRCVADSRTANLSHSAYATPYVHKQTKGTGWETDLDSIGFSVVASKVGMIPERTGLRADSSGVFHAIWPEPTDQEGALWSTTITVDGSRPKTFVSDNATDISHDVALEFVNCEFDDASGVYGLDVIVTNTGTKPIRTPISLRMESAYSRYFQTVAALGSDNSVTSDGAIWMVWPGDNETLLEPGKQTSPRRLSFLLTNTVSDSVGFGDLLAVRMKASSAP